MGLIDSRPRARDNCGFYPACYIAGDCGLDGWKTGNCGLCEEDKATERRKFHEGLQRVQMRNRLMARVQRGGFDHLDAGAPTPNTSDGEER